MLAAILGVTVLAVAEGSRFLGVVAKGLRIHWDPYDIAPHSMGPIEVTIPFAELGEVIDRRYR